MGIHLDVNINGISPASLWNSTTVLPYKYVLPTYFIVFFCRSQVVREACITVAYMSQVLRLKVDRFLEALMQNIINLIPNSAKVMSTSGIVAMRFIIQNTFSQRFLPIICSNISSKSRDIRRHCCEFLDQLLHTWPTATLVRKYLIP